MKQTIHCYLKQVRRALRCPRKERQALLKHLQADLEEYAAQQPALSLADLTEQFGSPEQLAADYLDTLDPARLVRFPSAALRYTRAALALFCVLLTFSVFWSLRHPVQPIPGDGEVTPEMAEDVKVSHCMFDFLVRNYCRRFGEQAADGSYHIKENDEIGLYRYLYAVGVTPGLIRGTEEQTQFVRGTHGMGYDPGCENPHIEGYIKWFTNPNANRTLVLYNIASP